MTIPEDLHRRFLEVMDPRAATNAVPTIHRTEYPAISPSRPENDQSDRTVLITGGGIGIGFAIAKAFVLAQAARVIIVGRRANVLANAVAELEKLGGGKTKVVSKEVDASNTASIDAMWKFLAEEKITVDVLVINAAIGTEPKPLVDLDAERIRTEFDTNVLGPIHVASGFSKQQSDAPGAIIYVSTLSANTFYASQHPFVVPLPGYGLTKNSATLAVQLIARDVDPEKTQVIMFSPGAIFTEEFAKYATEDALPFDDPSLPGGFAVWAATKQARFLHGRFVWASWDVDELASSEVRKRMEADDTYLRVGIIGLNGGYLA